MSRWQDKELSEIVDLYDEIDAGILITVENNNTVIMAYAVRNGVRTGLGEMVAQVLTKTMFGTEVPDRIKH